MSRTPNDWTTDTHASWGKICVFRTSGQTDLFRSSLRHHNWITLSIRRAKTVNTGGAHDFMSDGEELIEVSLSETQFARMITSIGMGEGAACTIERIDGERMPECPPQDRKQFVIDAHNEHLDGHREDISEMLGRLQQMLENKKRPTLRELGEIIHSLSCYTGNFDSNQRFYREQFQEQMEAVIEEAKTEIEGHLLRMAGKIGIEQAKAEAPKLQ